MSKFRFHVAGQPISDWEEEVVRSGVGQHTAVARIIQLRQQYPDAAIGIERAGDDRTVNRVKLYRYRIKVGESVYYSRAFQEQEKDAGLAQIREEFPKAEITEESNG